MSAAEAAVPEPATPDGPFNQSVANYEVLLLRNAADLLELTYDQFRGLVRKHQEDLAAEKYKVEINTKARRTRSAPLPFNGLTTEDTEDRREGSKISVFLCVLCGELFLFL